MSCMKDPRMDSKKLLDAAREGDVEMLKKLLHENPSVASDIAPEPVLHVAAKAGQVNFVVELMKHNRTLARELDGDGFRPLDIATLMGNIEIVRELLRVDPELCLLAGKDRRTVLHYAAIKGRIEVIDHVICTRVDSIKHLTVHRETALHLAVKNHQIDAFKALVNWLEIQNLQPIINWADGDGNTVLHIAASKKQHECIELLLRNSNIHMAVDVNATNAKGLTAVDVFDIVTENSADIRTREILQLRRTGATKNKHYTISDFHSEHSKDWFKYFRFQLERDSPSDTRNALLVVAALIATVTFQASVTPPSGVQVTSTPNNQTSSQNQTKTNVSWSAAFAIFGSHATSFLFLFSNSLGLTASLSIIIYLTVEFPFQRELLISIFSMLFTYGLSISSILKGKEKEKQVIGYVLLTVAFILPILLRWLPTWGKNAWKKGKEAWKKGKERYSKQNLLPTH